MAERHLFLSPHYDDTVYSCAATMYTLAQSGAEVLNLTVMAGLPQPPFPQTPVLADNLTRWQAGEHPMQTRRIEDQNAAGVLGIETLYMPCLDCLYRTDETGEALYPTEASLWQVAHTADPVAGQLSAFPLAMSRFRRVYAPLAIMPSDWALIGAYIYYASIAETPLLVAIITGTILVSGILRLGSTLGTIETIGGFIAAIVALSMSDSVGLDALLNDPLEYAPAALITLLMAALATVWYNSIDEENHVNRKRVRREIEESRARLDDMRERARAFAEMAAMLNSTLDYDKILDAAMDIGRLSIRHDPRERVISMALMVINDTDLEIATARGIPHIDLNHRLEGRDGLIADAIAEGYPLIINDGEYDPELRRLRCFKNIRTTLCIPLRSNFETYGVLIFGSTAEGAINEDHTDTLAAIGTQAAIALHNAALYTDLHDEKEKLMRVEENGRKALVRDLHDVPTQTISAVAMNLSTIPIIAERHPEQLRDEVESIRQMALRASEELRHVIDVTCLRG